MDVSSSSQKTEFSELQKCSDSQDVIPKEDSPKISENTEPGNDSANNLNHR